MLANTDVHCTVKMYIYYDMISHRIMTKYINIYSTKSMTLTTKETILGEHDNDNDKDSDNAK